MWKHTPTTELVKTEVAANTNTDDKTGKNGPLITKHTETHWQQLLSKPTPWQQNLWKHTHWWQNLWKHTIMQIVHSDTNDREKWKPSSKQLYNKVTRVKVTLQGEEKSNLKCGWQLAPYKKIPTNKQFFLKEEEKRKNLMRQYKTCNFWGSKPLFQKPKNNLTDDKWKYYTYPVMDGHATKKTI